VESHPNSLERLIPDRIGNDDATGSETLALHLQRYEFAAAHSRPGRVLDIACGAGYGAHLVASRLRGQVAVTGVDLSEASIAYARDRYGAAGVSFHVADANEFDDGEGFHTIVSLETVEHLEDPAKFIAHLVAMLRPGGVLVASVPTTPSVDVNPYHRHDFSERSFRALVEPHGLEEIGVLRQVQRVPLTAVLTRNEARLADRRPHLLSWYVTHPVALARRIGSTLAHGLANHYLTVAWRASGLRTRAAP
jgi:2-polyprenyl-3-methyl-5-hydroxy-6-metoxy-1,4-benzoquinol methylase